MRRPNYTGIVIVITVVVIAYYLFMIASNYE